MNDYRTIPVQTYCFGPVSPQAAERYPELVAAYAARRAARESGKRLWGYSTLAPDGPGGAPDRGFYRIRVALDDAHPASTPFIISDTLDVLTVLR